MSECVLEEPSAISKCILELRYGAIKVLLYKVFPKLIKFSRNFGLFPFFNKLSSSEIRRHDIWLFCGEATMPETMDALYTGRILTLRKPVDIILFELKNEKEFRRWVEETMFQKLENVIYENRTANNKFYQCLSHEYCHHLILKETSLAVLLDSVSWALRIDLIYLTEIFHKVTKYPRVNLRCLSKNEATENLKVFESKIADLVNNADFVEVFKDTIIHLSLVTIYTSIISVIIEPVTWAILEPEYVERQEETLRNYFSDVRLRNLASEVLTLSIKYLKNHDVSELINIARKSLDIPMLIINEYRQEGITTEVSKILVERFKLLIDGGDIEIAPKEDKKLFAVLLYIFNDNFKINKILSNVIAEILNEEIHITKYLFKTIAKKCLGFVYEKPAIFVPVNIGDDIRIWRYDPLAGLTSEGDTKWDSLYVNRSKRKFETLEDLVGNLPLTLRTALLILLYLDKLVESGFKDINKDKFSSSIIKILKLGCFLPKNGKEIYIDVLTELIDIIEEKNLSFSKLLMLFGCENSKVIKDFLEFWLYFVLRMGKYVEYLGGLHGAWF